MLHFSNFLDFTWIWILHFENILDCGWTWTEFLKIRTGSAWQNMTVRSALVCIAVLNMIRSPDPDPT